MQVEQLRDEMLVAREGMEEVLRREAAKDRELAGLHQVTNSN